MVAATGRGRAGTGARLRARAIVVVATVVAAAVAWALAEFVFGRDHLVVQQEGQKAMDLGIGAILFFSVVPALLGWALLEVLERVVPSRARIVWTVVAVVVLALSFAPLLGVEATGATKVTLGLFHVVVGVVLIAGFWRTGAPRAAE